jgi:hypothetical protein
MKKIRLVKLENPKTSLDPTRHSRFPKFLLKFELIFNYIKILFPILDSGAKLTI